jgi:type IV pilus assembly protein PilO
MTFDELKQLDPKDPGRWPFAVRVGAIALFFLVASLALLWFGVWNSNKDELANFESEEIKLRTEFRDKHAKAVNLDLYKEQLADIERSFGAMLRQLPGRSEMDALINDISQAGNGVVTHEQFLPQPVVLHDFYAEQPIKIRVSGSYHQLAEFVSTVAAQPRIVTLHDAVITARRGSFDDLQLDVTARTYRYLDDEEQAAKANEKKATNKNSRRR